MNISPIASVLSPVSSFPSLNTEAAQSLDSGNGAAAVLSASQPNAPDATGQAATKSFGKMLTDAIAETNQAQLHAGDMTARFASGEPLDVHQVMIASQEASVSLNLAMQVRNKLVDAYTEIMHVNV